MSNYHKSISKVQDSERKAPKSELLKHSQEVQSRMSTGIFGNERNSMGKRSPVNVNSVSNAMFIRLTGFYNRVDPDPYVLSWIAAGNPQSTSSGPVAAQETDIRQILIEKVLHVIVLFVTVTITTSTFNNNSIVCMYACLQP